VAQGYIWRHTEFRGGYRDESGDDVNRSGSDAPREDDALEEENLVNSPATDSEDDISKDNGSSEEAQKSPAEQAVENQERALETGEELPG
jgi:hypothetical protein